jgi:hypothetical protein
VRHSIAGECREILCAAPAGAQLRVSAPRTTRYRCEDRAEVLRFTADAVVPEGVATLAAGARSRRVASLKRDAARRAIWVAEHEGRAQ